MHREPRRFTIQPASIRIAANNDIGLDNPDVAELGYTIIGSLVEADRASLGVTLGLGEPAVVDGRKTYPIVVSYVPNANYAITTANGAYTVSDDLVFTASGYTGVYDGMAHSISVAVTQGEANV